MPFYSDDLIEEVRGRNDIVDVIGGYVRLQKKGNTNFGLCPFHSEKTGSFSVSPHKQMFYCFGCGAGGSVIDFTMKLYEISFRQAVLRLDMDFNLGLFGIKEPSKEEQSAILEARRREAERKAALDQEYRAKAADHRYWWEIKKYFAPAPGDTVLHPLYAEALRRLPDLEYWLDENIGR